MTRLLWAALAPALVGCSLIDGSFNECHTDSDCGANKSCVPDPQNASQRFCVPVPVGCNGVPDAGILSTYGDLDAGELHFGATLSFTSSTGVNLNKLENLNAMSMALDQINQNVGAGHKTFVLHVCDNGGNNALIQPQVAWMMNQLNIPAIIISGSSSVITAADFTVPAGAVIMSQTATSPAIAQLPATSDGGYRLIWRTAPSDDIQGRVIAGLLSGPSPYDAGASIFQASPITLFYSNDTYGNGLQQAILDHLDAGSRTINTIQYTKGAVTSTEISQLVSSQPQVTVCIGFPYDIPTIVNGAADAGLTVAKGHHWIFTDAAQDPATIANVKDPSQIATAIGTTPAQNQGLAYPNFSSDFRNQFGAEPGNYGFTSHSYDAMYLLALAGSYAVGLDNSQPMTGNLIAEGLTRVSGVDAGQYKLQITGYVGARSDLQSGKLINVDGASGSLDFNPLTGEAPGPIEIWGIADGGFNPLGYVFVPST